MRTRIMKAVVIFSCIFLLYSAAVAAGEEPSIHLASQRRRAGVVQEFWLPVSRLKQLPTWIPGREKIPLDLASAIQIARKWLQKKEGGGDISKITISAMHPENEPYRRHFFYRIDFQAAAYDQAACVVLMDGTVVEPQNVELDPRDLGTPPVRPGSTNGPPNEGRTH